MKGGSSQLTVKQLQLRVGVKPSLQDCLDGLMLLYDMHHSEYGTWPSSDLTNYLHMHCLLAVLRICFE